MKEILQTKKISLKCLAKIFLTERKPFPIFGTSNKAVRVLYLYHSQSTYTSKKVIITIRISVISGILYIVVNASQH